MGACMVSLPDRKDKSQFPVESHGGSPTLIRPLLHTSTAYVTVLTCTFPVMASMRCTRKYIILKISAGFANL